MPKVYESICDYADVEKNICYKVLFFAQQPEYKTAYQNECERENAFDKNCLPEACENGLHYRICFVKFSRSKQSFGAQPVDEIEKVEKKDFLIERVTRPYGGGVRGVFGWIVGNRF